MNKIDCNVLDKTGLEKRRLAWQLASEKLVAKAAGFNNIEDFLSYLTTDEFKILKDDADDLYTKLEDYAERTGQPILLYGLRFGNYL